MTKPKKAKEKETKIGKEVGEVLTLEKRKLRFNTLVGKLSRHTKKGILSNVVMVDCEIKGVPQNVEIVEYESMWDWGSFSFARGMVAFCGFKVRGNLWIERNRFYYQKQKNDQIN